MSAFHESFHTSCQEEGREQKLSELRGQTGFLGGLQRTPGGSEDVQVRDWDGVGSHLCLVGGLSGPSDCTKWVLKGQGVTSPSEELPKVERSWGVLVSLLFSRRISKETKLFEESFFLGKRVPLIGILKELWDTKKPSYTKVLQSWGSLPGKAEPWGKISRGWKCHGEMAEVWAVQQLTRRLSTLGTLILPRGAHLLRPHKGQPPRTRYWAH